MSDRISPHLGIHSHRFAPQCFDSAFQIINQGSCFYRQLVKLVCVLTSTLLGDIQSTCVEGRYIRNVEVDSLDTFLDRGSLDVQLVRQYRFSIKCGSPRSETTRLAQLRSHDHYRAGGDREWTFHVPESGMNPVVSGPVRYLANLTQQGCVEI